MKHQNVRCVANKQLNDVHDVNENGIADGKKSDQTWAVITFSFFIVENVKSNTGPNINRCVKLLLRPWKPKKKNYLNNFCLINRHEFRPILFLTITQNICLLFYLFHLSNH